MKKLTKKRVGAIAVIISMVAPAVFASTAIASPPTDGELRAVISTWRKVRQVIEKGAPVRESVPGYSVGRAPAKEIEKGLNREILEIAREVEPWREPWFVTINQQETHDAAVFFAPDEIQGRLRRGKCVSISLWHARLRARLPELKPHFFRVSQYVQIDKEPLDRFAPGENNMPFAVSGEMTLDEVDAIVDLIRGPKPEHKKMVASPLERRREVLGFQLDRAAQILIITKDDNGIYVRTGHVYGPLDGSGQFIECKKSSGVWIIKNVSIWMS